MKLDELHSEIEADSEVDNSKLIRSSIQIPKLHAKYYRLLSQEGRLMKKLELDMDSLRLSKFEYYTHKAPDAVYLDKPLPQKILKGDVDLYMDGDKEIIELKGKIYTQQLKVKAIEGFIKELNQRGYLIKAIIDWNKFTNGVN